MKYGKDYREFDKQGAEQALRSEGFVPKTTTDEDDDGNEIEVQIIQQHTHRETYWWVNAATTQEATISVENKTGRATISYSMLKSQRCKPRSREEIRRANFVLYD
jgi:hypothetical protein